MDDGESSGDIEPKPAVLVIQNDADFGAVLAEIRITFPRMWSCRRATLKSRRWAGATRTNRESERRWQRRGRRPRAAVPMRARSVRTAETAIKRHDLPEEDGVLTGSLVEWDVATVLADLARAVPERNEPSDGILVVVALGRSGPF